MKPSADGFFRSPFGEAPATEGGDADTDQADNGSGVKASMDALVQLPSDEDIWAEPGDAPSMSAGFRTWEVFRSGGTVETHQPLFISEGGPAVYDALLSSPADPMHLGNVGVPLVETKAYFSSMLSVLMGRESVLFRRENDASAFRPVLSEMRISDHSRQVLHGLEEQALWCGSTFLQLRAWVQAAYTARSGPCVVALASTISQVLQAIERRVVIDGRSPRSLLRLQVVVQDVFATLSPFRDLMTRLGRNYSDENVINLVFGQAISECGDLYSRNMLREVMRRVSTPWTDSIEKWIGTKADHDLPLAKSLVERGSGFVELHRLSYTDDHGREKEHTEYALNRSKLPAFFPEDVAELIFETGRSLRFIRSFHPQHPLNNPAIISSCRPPRVEWLYSWTSILELEDRISCYKERLCDRLDKCRPRPTPNDLPVEETSAEFRKPGGTLNYFDLDQDGIEDEISASMKQLDQPISDPILQDPLYDLVRARFSENGGADRSCYDNEGPPPSLIPVLSFGSIASAQAEVINQESLRLLFEAHHIRSHLCLLRDYFLLGNGTFCSRLSQALFDRDSEPVNREPGACGWGGIRGLRLGGRSSWPPAGSELRLVLMGVLTDSYRDSCSVPRIGEQDLLTRKSDGLPGNLSFAVRDMSQEEMDKCRDPNSIWALDFLRLAYQTPDELASIITPKDLRRYDAIFMLLLRVLRMQSVVAGLFRDVVKGHRSPGREGESTHSSFLFVREAQHFIYSVSSYFLDDGVATAWRDLEQRLDQVRVKAFGETKPGCEHGEGLQGPRTLCELHSAFIRRIMSALFLRKRQRAVLRLLEDIFALLLMYAQQMQPRDGSERADKAEAQEEKKEAEARAEGVHREFRRKMQAFIAACSSLAEEGQVGYEGTSRGAGPGDGGELVAQLLTRLDLGGYYDSETRQW